MTQTRDLIKKMADFFTGEEFYEKGEDARLELSPDDVRCMNEVIKACGNAISRQAVKEQMLKYGFHAPDMTVTEFVEDLSPVTPQQKTGHWISLGVQGEVDGQIVQVFTCSECGAISIFRMASGNIVNGDICPNCGSYNGGR